MDVLEKIDEMRIRRCWSINNLAMEAGLTQSTLNNLYSRRTEPKLSTLRSICAAFGITLAEFFAEMEDDFSKRSSDRREEDEMIKLFARLDSGQKQAILSLLRCMN